MSAVLKDFAAESGHWYCAKTGEPRYTILGKNGNARNTTVADARKAPGTLVPSTTTILKLAAAPNLVNWFKEQVAKTAFAERPREGESEADYIGRILPLAEEVAKKARKTGEDIHGAIEQHYLGSVPPIGWWYHVMEAVNAVADWSGVSRWDAERSFASQKYGFGGKLDLSAPGFVVDFKTSENIDTKKIYDDHARQLAAYRMGLEMPDAHCAIVFVSSTEPKARLIEVEEDALQKAWDEFKCLLRLFYLTKNLPMPEGI